MSDEAHTTTDPAQGDPRTLLTGHDVEAALLPDWRIFFGRLHARFETGSFARGVELVRRIGDAADAADHHPDVDLTYPRVDVRLSSHDVGGVTARDIALAREITDIAGSLGLDSRPGETSQLEIGLDTWDADEIRPFWAALLGYDTTDRPDEIIDPDGHRPTLWFQETDAHETPRQRYHVDLRVPPEVADARVRAALEAGGTMVSDERAPTFWVLADAQGNRCCITTWLGRGA